MMSIGALRKSIGVFIRGIMIVELLLLFGNMMFPFWALCAIVGSFSGKIIHFLLIAYYGFCLTDKARKHALKHFISTKLKIK